MLSRQKNGTNLASQQPCRWRSTVRRDWSVGEVLRCPARKKGAFGHERELLVFHREKVHDSKSRTRTKTRFV